MREQLVFDIGYTLLCSYIPRIFSALDPGSHPASLSSLKPQVLSLYPWVCLNSDDLSVTLCFVSLMHVSEYCQIPQEGMWHEGSCIDISLVLICLQCRPSCPGWFIISPILSNHFCVVSSFSYLVGVLTFCKSYLQAKSRYLCDYLLFCIYASFSHWVLKILLLLKCSSRRIPECFSKSKRQYIFFYETKPIIADTTWEVYLWKWEGTERGLLLPCDIDKERKFVFATSYLYLLCFPLPNQHNVIFTNLLSRAWL